MSYKVIIPARLKSTRLPEKILLDLGGKPLIERVFEKCCQATSPEDIWIACDDTRVFELCKKFTQNVKLTNPNHQSGTDRIAEVAAELDCEIIVNLQGDEPFFDKKIISDLSSALKNSQAAMASVFAYLESKDDVNNPNLVKVVTDKDGFALYFSRHAIPFMRDATEGAAVQYKKHIGIYAYKREFLLQFANLPLSYLENMEKLEQLRALESGFKILMLQTNSFEKGIDTPEDLENARLRFKQD